MLLFFIIITAYPRARDFQCQRCLKELDDPVTTSCCKENVCRQCLDFKLRWEMFCPVCDRRIVYRKTHLLPMLHVPCSKFFKSVKDSLRVRCIEKDCQMEMKYKDLDLHWKEKCQRLIKCEYCSSENRVCDSHACTESLNAAIRKNKVLIDEQKIEKDEVDKIMKGGRRGGFWDRGPPPNLLDW
ncbi:unnamed protein product [Oikopleura dioica]|uniref:RING-type domain-containing protein n=1 Tax=Oikopleura dioica TaxID=34765 RepID=E4Y8J2_OIKDI|nr:unnamed protein product [Oikopleura dioica]